MMGSEEGGFIQAKLYASREEMENLVLDEKKPSNGKFHPLSLPSSTKEDPLNSPSSNKSPNFSDNHYLEPPYYADVIFSPIDQWGIESPNFDSPIGILSRSSSSLSSSGDYLKISVSNPQKEQELNSANLIPGGSTYVTYLITTRTNMVEFGPEVSVRRRFKDKNVVESQVMQKQEFVEQRRLALEKYLCRLAAHPVIKKSEELRVFLQCQGKLPLATATDVASRMLDGAVNLLKLCNRRKEGEICCGDSVSPKLMKGQYLNSLGFNFLCVFEIRKFKISNFKSLRNRQMSYQNAEKVSQSIS
ncbi:hypothetical protein MKW94_030622, partial [Papaver nudicaule]|nr:hypothetical protein [Papaver nudicaule]